MKINEDAYKFHEQFMNKFMKSSSTTNDPIHQIKKIMNFMNEWINKWTILMNKGMNNWSEPMSCESMEKWTNE